MRAGDARGRIGPHVNEHLYSYGLYSYGQGRIGPHVNEHLYSYGLYSYGQGRIGPHINEHLAHHLLCSELRALAQQTAHFGVGALGYVVLHGIACRHMCRHAIGMCYASFERSRQGGRFEYRHIYTRATDIPSAMPL